MRRISLLLIALPLTALAQPPAPYVCTHLISGPNGAPASCEAVADSVQFPSFEYFFPQTAASDPPSALSAPEIGARGLIPGATLALGLLAVGLGRKKRTDGLHEHRPPEDTSGEYPQPERAPVH